MKNLGKILKESRESKKISLETLSKNLNISRQYVIAIEADAFEKTPGDPYTRGFIRNISQYLNLDTDRIIEIYNNQNNKVIFSKKLNLPTVANTNYLIYLKYGITGLAAISLITIFYNFFYLQTNINKNYAITPQVQEDMVALIEEEELKRTIIEIKKFKKEQESLKLKNSKDIELVESESYQNIQNFNNQQYATSSAVANFDETIVNDPDLNKIIVRFIGDTWVQIKNSENNIMISKLMKKNEEFILSPSPYYLITTGNAGNIEIILDGNNFGKLGKKGQVLNAFKLTDKFNSL